MEQLQKKMLAMIQERYPLEPTPVPDDLRMIHLEDIICLIVPF